MRYDKARNNEITAGAGWDMLRFTTRNSEQELPQSVNLIKAKIDRLGGLHYAREDVVRYVSQLREPQACQLPRALTRWPATKRPQAAQELLGGVWLRSLIC